MPTACIICLEIIDSNVTALITCGHVFHRGCIEQWVTLSKTCPTCRTKTCSSQMLKLFVSEVSTVDVKENQKLIAKLGEKH